MIYLVRNATRSIQLHLRGMSTGVSLNYTKYQGNDELSPLLITHGLLGTSKNWSAIAKKIRKRTDRTVVIFDARNHGKSPWTLSLSYEGMVADLRKLYDSLNLRKAILMGHSMGGRTLLGFALVYPELVDKLISVDISQIPLERTKNIILDKYIYVEGLRNVKIPQNLSLFDTRSDIKKQLYPYVSEIGIREWLSLNLYKDSQGVSRWNVNIEALGKDELRNIAEFPKQWIDLKSNVPVLFICGEKSGFIQKEDHEAIQTQFFESTITYLPGTSHWLHAEKPNEFTETVLKFIS
ncbi:sn-1-specific diacylglycerol lipase ABHD11 [Lepeophtheirus salmonis]|uniref:sn-1-specific diacylglycerol lipase ABHD11 n=1 Tax=Lepeophtheirus salmonis TaxID=72036 RepID=UPI001AE93A53|nr:protein ABHD11-like [Lepeophtheirus salmonis]